MCSIGGINSSRSSVFWGEIAPYEHIAQFYEDESQLLHNLTGFVGGGLMAGESVIVIATPEHEAGLRRELIRCGIDLDSAAAEDRYIPLNAEIALATFMMNGWPDSRRFANLIEWLIARATAEKRRARAFGEMVALLWERGQVGATVHLEFLWNQFCRNYAFPLFCAYPKAGFTEMPLQSIGAICKAHSKVIVEGADAAAWTAAIAESARA